MKNQVSSDEWLLGELFRQMPEAVIFTDPLGTILEWGQFAGKVFGYTEEDVLGQPFQMLHAPLVREQMFQQILEVVRESGRFKGQIPCFRKDHSEILVEATVAPVTGRDHALVGYVSILREITRNDSPQLLAASEAFFRQLTEAMPQIVFVVDTIFHVSYFNQHWYDYTGHSRSASDYEWQSVVHPGDLERVMKAGKSSTDSKVPFETEYRLRRHDGTYRWHLGRSVEFKDTEGNVLRRLGVATDIDDQKRAKEQLNSYLENVPSPVFVMRGRDHVLEFMNEASKRMLQGGGFLGMAVREVDSAGVMTEIFEILDEVYRTGEMQSRSEFQTSFVLADGSIANGYFNFIVQPLKDPSGQVTGLMAIVIEVSEQVGFRRQIENQAKWWESVLNLIPIPLSFVDPVRRETIFGNRALNEMAGESLVGKRTWFSNNSLKITDEDDRSIPPERVPVERAARGETVRGCELVWHSPAGRFSVLASAEKLPSMYGQNETVVCVLQDITRLKQTELTLQHAIRSRDLFLSLASRELKNPLCALRAHNQAAVKILSQEGPLPFVAENAKRCLAMVEWQTDRLSKLIEDMFDAARAEPGRMVLQTEKVDLSSLAKEVAARLDSQVRDAGCELSVLASDPVVGCWDRVRIEQVVESILSNACKFGAGRPIALKVGQRDRSALLSIRDKGAGISRNDQFKIFNRFERLATHSGAGLRLGLFISKSIVEAHGGTITVDSELGKGATFTLYLPLEDL